MNDDEFALLRSIAIILAVVTIAYAIYHIGASSVQITDCNNTRLNNETKAPIPISVNGKIISTQTYFYLKDFCKKYYDMEMCKEFRLSEVKYGN
jgi:hypothetical protein